MQPDSPNLTSTLQQGRAAAGFLVGVILERQTLTLASGFPHTKWSLAEIILQGTLNDSSGTVATRQCTLLQHSETFQRQLWTSFELNFYRDGGESYWHALVGEQQQIYVVCQEDEQSEVAPLLVTADYDEAMAYQEADDTVLSTEMPAAIYQSLERFVLENYAPAMKKRRKRKKWHVDPSSSASGGADNQEQADEPFARKPRQA